MYKPIGQQFQESRQAFEDALEEAENASLFSERHMWARCIRDKVDHARWAGFTLGFIIGAACAALAALTH